MMGMIVAVRIRLLGLDALDREQGQAQVTHFPEQAVQRRLIGTGPVKRVSPSSSSVMVSPSNQSVHCAAQMALDPDLIDHSCTWLRFWCEFV